MNRQMIDLEKTMTKYLFDKRLEFNVYIELKNRQLTQCKMDKRFKKAFHKRGYMNGL